MVNVGIDGSTKIHGVGMCNSEVDYYTCIIVTQTVAICLIVILILENIPNLQLIGLPFNDTNL